MTEDGKAWSDQYSGKLQFHAKYKVHPVPSGRPAHPCLERIRCLVRRLRERQLVAIGQFAAETTARRCTVAASSGHTAMSWIGRWDGKAWGPNH
jgi:uracil-DNA glycosylase